MSNLFSNLEFLCTRDDDKFIGCDAEEGGLRRNALSDSGRGLGDSGISRSPAELFVYSHKVIDVHIQYVRPFGVEDPLAELRQIILGIGVMESPSFFAGLGARTILG